MGLGLFIFIIMGYIYLLFVNLFIFKTELIYLAPHMYIYKQVASHCTYSLVNVRANYTETEFSILGVRFFED